jgi:hypothetical protein
VRPELLVQLSGRTSAVGRAGGCTREDTISLGSVEESRDEEPPGEGEARIVVEERRLHLVVLGRLLGLAAVVDDRLVEGREAVAEPGLRHQPLAVAVVGQHHLNRLPLVLTERDELASAHDYSSPAARAACVGGLFGTVRVRLARARA